MEKAVLKFYGIAKKFLGGKIRTVVEIGARDCEETAGFAAMFPEARIYAFECNPETLPKCRDKVRGMNNVELIEKAVSDKDGPILFHPIDTKNTETAHADGNPGASSILLASGKFAIEKYIQYQIEVESTTLAAFARANDLEGIDLLWMDIQGAELMALKGMGELLGRTKLIHSEVEFFEIYRDQPLFAEVKKYLNQHGFSLWGFTYFGRYFADAIFVNNSLCGGLSWRDRVMYPYYRYFWAYFAFLGRLAQRAVD